LAAFKTVRVDFAAHVRYEQLHGGYAITDRAPPHQNLVAREAF
jgi:hypothetical protein